MKAPNCVSATPRIAEIPPTAPVITAFLEAELLPPPDISTLIDVGIGTTGVAGGESEIEGGVEGEVTAEVPGVTGCA
ncbi:hypothetical protein RERY_21920 [Rhodococcus erythropolis]|nr:hypothetical protein RERY_21920 [Rhodococcus erythropolis]